VVLLFDGGNLIAGTENEGIFLSTDGGGKWMHADMGKANLTVYAVVASGTSLIAGAYGGIYHSTDNGTSWTTATNELTNRVVRALAVCGPSLYAGTLGDGVFRSTDNGASWTVPPYARDAACSLTFAQAVDSTPTLNSRLSSIWGKRRLGKPFELTTHPALSPIPEQPLIKPHTHTA